LNFELAGSLMDDREYLLSYGNAGDFGRFQSAQRLPCRRGDRLVVQSHRGLEIGAVMCLATEGHGRLLKDKYVGRILRAATPEDEHSAQRMLRRGHQLFEDGRRLAANLDLPLEIIDAEVLLDGRQAILHYLRWMECDPRPLMDPLADAYQLLVTLHDLALPASVEDEDAGCGAGNCGSGTTGCGSCTSGNCSSCGSRRKQQALEPMHGLTAERAFAAAPVRTSADRETPQRMPLL
jgi:hypothetical protein